MHSLGFCTLPWPRHTHLMHSTHLARPLHRSGAVASRVAAMHRTHRRVPRGLPGHLMRMHLHFFVLTHVHAHVRMAGSLYASVDMSIHMSARMPADIDSACRYTCLYAPVANLSVHKSMRMPVHRYIIDKAMQMCVRTLVRARARAHSQTPVYTHAYAHVHPRTVLMPMHTPVRGSPHKAPPLSSHIFVTRVQTHVVGCRRCVGGPASEIVIV